MISFFLGLYRLGRLLVGRGYGYDGEGPPPTPPIITGPCMAGQVANVATRGVVQDPSCSLALLPVLECSLMFGDVGMSGTVQDESMEGVSIDVC